MLAVAQGFVRADIAFALHAGDFAGLSDTFGERVCVAAGGAGRNKRGCRADGCGDSVLADAKVFPQASYGIRRCFNCLRI